MRTAQVTTEKMIRKQLEQQLGIDLGDKKAFIREQVRPAMAAALLHRVHNLLLPPRRVTLAALSLLPRPIEPALLRQCCRCRLFRCCA